MRDRLIELLDELGVIVNVPVKVDEDGCGTYTIEGEEYVADYLLENGVICPPVKVGDMVYYITGIRNTIVKEAKVEEIYYGEGCFAYHLCAGYTYFTLQGEDLYLTKEEAERALKGGAEE